MKGICAIDAQKDKTFISFGTLKRSRLFFIQEAELDMPSGDCDILTYLKNNAESLNEEIRQKEKELSLKVDKLFLNLPSGEESIDMVYDTIPLKRNKKISSRDISCVRQHLEDISLNWDDHCLHNFIIHYEAGGKIYKEPPIGIKANKLSLKSCLVWIKEKTYREAKDIFDNLERPFAGFIYSGISAFSTPFDRYDTGATRVVLDIGHEMSKYVILSPSGFDFSKGFEFGIKKIIEAMGYRFSLPPLVAEEIFNRYVTFYEVPFHKEISVRNEDSYLHISIQTLNAFVKNYIREGLGVLLNEINRKLAGRKFSIAFIGRLSAKKGFYHFFRELITSGAEIVHCALGASSSFGCMKYGVAPFTRNKHLRQGSFLGRLLEIYKEYF